MKKTNKPHRNPKSNSKALQDFGYFMSMGFRIAGMVLGGAALGYAVDHWLNNETPIFTLVGSVLALIGALIQFVRSLI